MHTIVRLLVCLLVLTPLISTAQFAVPGESVQLTVTPRFPTPGETVSIQLNDYTIDTTGATIQWRADGEVLPNTANARTVTLTAPEAGVSRTVTVLLALRNGQTISADTTIIPSTTAVIIEADTMTPTWYAGRAVPSIGSQVRAIAIPDVGNAKPPSAYAYTWRLNNSVLQNGSQQGGYIQTFTMPRGGDVVLEVDVTDLETGQTVGGKALVVAAYEPELRFYEINPLRGISRLALPDISALIGSEMSIRAEPYYMANNIPDQDLFMEWSVNGQTIDNPNEDQQVVTLQNGGGTGTFVMDFHIRNLAELLQGIEDSFTIQF